MGANIGVEEIGYRAIDRIHLFSQELVEGLVAGAATVNCEVVAGNQHGGSEKWNPLDVIPVGMAQQQVGFAAAPGEVALAQRASQPVQPHTAIQDQELPVGGDYFDTGGIAPIAFITRVWCGR